MIRLQNHPVLKKRIRQDDTLDLAVPTWTLVRNAIKSGKADEALDYLDYACYETLTSLDSKTATVDMAVTEIAKIAGEDAVERFWRKKFAQRTKDFLAVTPDVEGAIQRLTQMFRGLYCDFTITEEKDRWVFRQAECGAGGRLRRSQKVALTTQPHNWTWGRSGVALYCSHCCLVWEIVPLELRGYPVKLCLYRDDPQEPCVQLVYKKPELIPADYYRRMGFPVWKKE